MTRRDFHNGSSGRGGLLTQGTIWAVKGIWFLRRLLYLAPSMPRRAPEVVLRGVQRRKLVQGLETGLYVRSGYEFLPRWWNKSWATP